MIVVQCIHLLNPIHNTNVPFCLSMTGKPPTNDFSWIGRPVSCAISHNEDVKIYLVTIICFVNFELVSQSSLVKMTSSFDWAS